MGDLALAALLVFVVNLVPALMPPTWAVLAVLHLTFDVPVVPLAVCGALAASVGRLVLALASRRYGRRLLNRERRDRLTRLGTWLDAKARWAAPFAVLVYSFGPIPSNQLFIAAGLTRMSLGRIFAAFLAGRLVSYPLWIGAADVAAHHLGDLFTSRLSSAPVILVEVVLIALLVLFTRVDWERVVTRIDPTVAPPRA